MQTFVKKAKNVVLGTLCLILLAACPTPAKDQKIESSAMGYMDQIVVETSFKDGKLADVEVVSHRETPEVFSRAWPRLKKAIIASNSAKVDTISSATFTSSAILSAVNKAFEESGITQSEVKKSEAQQDSKTKLLIIGGGPSGLAAAISAKENGLDDIILIEKEGMLSGNGKFDLNFYDVFNTQAQKDNGVEDSKEAFIKDKAKSGEAPDRLEAWANEIEGVDAWLRSFGVDLNHNYNKRSHMHTKDLYAGPKIQDGMEAYIKKLGLDVRLDTKGLDLLQDESGKIIGAKVDHKGQTYTIYADSILIATGGFSSNPNLLAKYAPGSEKVATSNQQGTTGDYIDILQKLGADFTKMDDIRIFPTILMPCRDLTNSGAGSIFINQDGDRFINERTGKLEMAQAILNQEKTWMIVDSLKQEQHANVRKQIKQGKFIEAQTLEELAEKIKVSPDKLVKVVKDYNQHALDQSEDSFGQVPERALKEDGPFYTSQVQSAVHMTKGGVVTNVLGQVVKTDGTAFDNLYASGEVSFQSGGYSQSVIWGKIAGRNIAESLVK